MRASIGWSNLVAKLPVFYAIDLAEPDNQSLTGSGDNFECVVSMVSINTEVFLGIWGWWGSFRPRAHWSNQTRQIHAANSQ